MVLSGMKIHLNLIKISETTTMKTVMKHIFLKLLYNILKNYLIFTVIIFTFLTERMKTEKVKKFKIRKFKTGIKSWINIEKRHIES